MRRILPILLLLAAVVAAPLLLRRTSELADAGSADDRLVIVSPHNETIRSEFGEAFARHWKALSGRSLHIDWRIPGGTSDIRRTLDSAYTAADAAGSPGVGIDVFFGGGEPDFKLQAGKGRLVELEVFARHPEWFEDDVIPARFTGETYYDEHRKWAGVCLSQMGICHNGDSLRRLGLPPPKRWSDLGDPGYAGYLALADPTKSGSVGRAFEMIVQEQMQAAIAELGDGPAGREEGWRRGLNLLQRMAANARYFTDSASKVPHDVAQGSAAAGTCIDFYGRTYEEKFTRADGSSRLRWTAPQGGTSISVDPVAVFRGAPRADIAQEFVVFCLGREGQLLWNTAVGKPGGPRERSPRRLPVRRDIYSAENLANFIDADALPYERGKGFQYRRDLTGGASVALAQLFRAMAIDPHDEMKESWRALRLGTGPGVALEESSAGKVFFDVSHVTHADLMERLVPLVSRPGGQLAAGREMARLSAVFRANYRRAETLAREGGAP